MHHVLRIDKTLVGPLLIQSTTQRLQDAGEWCRCPHRLPQPSAGETAPYAWPHQTSANNELHQQRPESVEKNDNNGLLGQGAGWKMSLKLARNLPISYKESVIRLFYTAPCDIAILQH